MSEQGFGPFGALVAALLRAVTKPLVKRAPLLALKDFDPMKVLSAPGNDVCSYCLQCPACKRSIVDFLQPANFIRSASVGALIMGICTVTAPLLKKLLAMLNLNLFGRKNPCGFVIFLLVLKHMQARSSFIPLKWVKGFHFWMHDFPKTSLAAARGHLLLARTLCIMCGA